VSRILITGAGSVGGVNFSRAVKSVNSDLYLVGTDCDEYYIHLALTDKKYLVPRSTEPNYVDTIVNIAKNEDVVFIHPQPEIDVEIFSENIEKFRDIKLLIPNREVVKICRDKYLTYLKLKNIVSIPETETYSPDVIDKFREKFGSTVWLRARKGAGARLATPITSREQAEYWVNYWIIRGISKDEFIVQQYVEGRDVAWDSLWINGKLIASFTRERLRYIFPHLSPSRLTGTPTVARIVRDEKINEACIKAIKTIDPNATGFYCVDLKVSSDETPYITEINVKAHTTLALWSFIATKVLKLDWRYNLSYHYVSAGIWDKYEEVGTDIYPEELTLIRHIDAGLVVVLPSGEKIKIPI